jgi:hypothetical protein
MEYTIQEKDLPSFDIEFADKGRRWVAEVRPADEGDLLVNVFRLTAPPAHVNDADLVGPPVGWWRVSSEAEPGAVALRIAGLLAVLTLAG